MPNSNPPAGAHMRAWWCKWTDPSVLLALVLALGGGTAWFESKINAEASLDNRVAGLEKRVDQQSAIFDRAQQQLGDEVKTLGNQVASLSQAFAAVNPRLDSLAEMLRDLRDEQRRQAHGGRADR